jgi:hypothetical protein
VDGAVPLPAPAPALDLSAAVGVSTVPFSPTAKGEARWGTATGRHERGSGASTSDRKLPM